MAVTWTPYERQILERNRRARYQAEQAAKDTVEHAERLARAKRKARRGAAISYSFWLVQHRPDDLTEHLAAQRTVRELDAELREVLCHDQSLIDEVTRKAAR
jgi:hypothetical protein